jgi:hypothetical protein
MISEFRLEGIWKGEYVYDSRIQAVLIQTPVPFILRIKTVNAEGMFEGMCQDDPLISKIDLPANVYGKMRNGEIAFTKKYSKTLMQDNFGSIIKLDDPNPDLVYNAKVSNDHNKLFGSWKMERTFRKINDHIIEFGPYTGVWWMNRM